MAYQTILKMEAKQANRLVNWLMKQRYSRGVTFYYIAPWHYVAVPDSLDLGEVRKKLRGIEFFID